MLKKILLSELLAHLQILHSGKITLMKTLAVNVHKNRIVKMLVVLTFNISSLEYIRIEEEEEEKEVRII